MLTENLKPFPCNGCGKCCANVHLSEITLPLSRGDGICRHLDTATRRCRIYEQRPDICQVELQYRENYSAQFSWDEFIAINLEICESLPDRIASRYDELISDITHKSL
ncbi:YkgJ family cysteine cluster protein [Photobacterium kagoshimensis]|uniref:YkgJ family cysteine cluster protein n=1 Tax=Photobacterium kagoshimensis TaxID=2910242 RepID=UPI003D141547